MEEEEQESDACPHLIFQILPEWQGFEKEWPAGVNMHLHQPSPVTTPLSLRLL